jgi:hypothetical protein
VRRRALARAFSSDLAAATGVLVALQLCGLVAVAQFLHSL